MADIHHGNRSFFVGNYEKTLRNCGYYFIGKSNNTEHNNSEKLSILDFCLFVQVAFLQNWLILSFKVVLATKFIEDGKTKFDKNTPILTFFRW